MSEYGDVEGTLQITADQFQEFLNEKGVTETCRCGAGRREIAQEPDGRPSLNAIADPRARQAENWFFWTLCSNCLRAEFYSAGHIWLYLKSKKNG